MATRWGYDLSSGSGERPAPNPRRKLNDAMWSLYFHGSKLMPEHVPPEAQPIPLNDAVKHILSVYDEHREARCAAVIDQTLRARGSSARELFSSIAEHDA